MLLEAWWSIYQIYERRGGSNLETSWICVLFLWRGLRTQFSTSTIAQGQKTLGDSLRVGKHPSLPLVDPFRVHRLQFIDFQFVFEDDCGITVDLFEESLPQLYGLYVHVKLSLSNIINWFPYSLLPRRVSRVPSNLLMMHGSTSFCRLHMGCSTILSTDLKMSESASTKKYDQILLINPATKNPRCLFIMLLSLSIFYA